MDAVVVVDVIEAMALAAISCYPHVGWHAFNRVADTFSNQSRTIESMKPKKSVRFSMVYLPEDTIVYFGPTFRTLSENSIPLEDYEIIRHQERARRHGEAKAKRTKSKKKSKRNGTHTTLSKKGGITTISKDISYTDSTVTASSSVGKGIFPAYEPHPLIQRQQGVRKKQAVSSKHAGLPLCYG